MARNLRYQFLHAIESNFKEGMSKHSIKQAGQMNGTRIFSYSDRNNLIGLSSNFCTYMKENYPEVKMVKDINSNHIQGFLNSKASTCSSATLKQYESKFNKLEKVVNNTYHCHANYKGFSTPHGVNATKIRNSSMSKSDFKKLENSFSNSKSSAKVAIQLTARAGLRVSECTKLQGRDIDLNKGVIRVIDGKGGRDREVPIREQDRQYFTVLKSQYRDMERVCPVHSDSINKAISREMERIGIKSNYEDTSIHAIRKMYAQEQYDAYREQGMEINQALGAVSVDLGHGEQRIQLMKEYVLNIH